MTEQIEKIPQAGPAQSEEEMEILTGPDQYDPAKYKGEPKPVPEALTPPNPEDADFQRFQKEFGKGMTFMQAWSAYAKMKGLEIKRKKDTK